MSLLKKQNHTLVKDCYTLQLFPYFLFRANDALTVVNDWQLYLFKNGDAAASIFGAVGIQATATVVSPSEGSIFECKSVSVY